MSDINNMSAGKHDQNVRAGKHDQNAEELSRSFAYTSKLDALAAWGQRNSLWPLPYGTACCGIEMMSVMGPKYDIARFGAEVVRFSPRQADLLIVAGTITEKMAPILVRIYQQMLEPKYVLSMGACASSGGFYRAYHVLQGADKVIPVDVYVPGCPPTPEAVLDGIMALQDMIKRRAPRPWKDNWKSPYEINSSTVPDSLTSTNTYKRPLEKSGAGL